MNTPLPTDHPHGLPAGVGAATDTADVPASRQRPGSHRAAWLAVLFLVGVAAGSGRLDFLGEATTVFYRAYVQAQGVLLQARGNVSPDGLAEYAALAGDATELERFVTARPGWRLRESKVPGWTVVAAPADERGVAATLEAQPFVQAAWENRGLWICH